MFLLIVLLLPTLSAFPLLDSCTFLDLSYPFNEKTIYWPTAKSFKLQEVHKGETSKGYFYSANNFEAAEHGGTHLDAPIHFYKDGVPADKVPLSNLIGEACVIDIRAKTKDNPDYLLLKSDITDWEADFGSINRCIVVIKTGWEAFWPDKTRYLGTDTKNVNLLHFPGIHEEAAELLAKERKVKAVGLDTASLDYGQSTHFKTHTILFAAGIPGMENLMNLNKLPTRGATLIALPMKIQDGSGGPLRVVAFGWQENDPCKLSNNSGIRAPSKSVLMIAFFLILLCFI